ncbi:DUF4062 domain-containing protein [Roseateles sp.]|uniref:DUF4062 domain-containing protein n=1 Tax=Roseateles sp. TaxID=1971397 RepID=UPI0031D0A694
MAKPRIFVSSTYFDLRTVRDDLDRFIRSMGFEPVRHERGHVSYGKDDAPETYAYREIESCEMLVCIIGGRFGSTSKEGPYSITQKELKTALERGKQVYIFVEESVHHEHRYYAANKSVVGIKYTAVDNVKIHEFLEEIYALPKGNPIFQFGVSSDITSMLSEQWAGLFQRLLVENSIRSHATLIDELQRSLQTVGQLVQFLTEEKGKGDKAINEILFASHPIFEDLRKKLRNKYRIYFSNVAEMKEWLEAAKSFEEELFSMETEYYEFVKEYPVRNRVEIQTLLISRQLFEDDGRLIPRAPGDWNDQLVQVRRETKKSDNSATNIEDEIPF